MSNTMSYSIGIVLTLVSVIATSRALPDIHKQMSPEQLQSVFHVDSVHAVPQYEIVQLLHHNLVEQALATPHYRRRRRSINVINLPTENTSSSLKEVHHVKKDLSKNPYYSDLKEKASHEFDPEQPINANSLIAEKLKQHKKLLKLKEIKEHKVSLNAFGENLNLTLLPTQGLFKESPHKLRMWTVDNESNATHGLNIEEIIDEEHLDSENVGEVFQDEKNMAAILMRKHLETGDLMMEGSIGHDLVIKPLPHHLSPNKDEVHHVVYKREASQMDHLSDFAFMEPDDIAASEKLERLQKRQKRSTGKETHVDEANHEEFLEKYSADVGADSEDYASRTRSKRQAPFIIYPEILVIVDYDGYRLHGGDNLQVKRYFISFWNGVDLRYRLLKGPRIRISIAGIIISRGRDATPYLERNRVGRDAIDSAAALTDMGKYLFRERRLPVYDIAVAITKYDMCRRRKGGRCTKGTAGFAYVGGACVVNKRLEKVNSVAIIEDTGGFSGIIVAAHEVGHLLGAVHDGSPPPSYLGGPGAQRCRWEDGYIMSDLRHTERGFRWSPCTVQSFHHFLNGDTATCLHNAPHEDSALGRSLPGSLLSLDAQCRRDRGTYACFKDERVCAQLFCFDAQTGYCVAYRPAAEGSSCGNGMQCLDGRCAAVASNAIPNYSPFRLAYNSTQTESNHDEILDNITNNSQGLTKSTSAATASGNIDENENDPNNNHHVDNNETIKKPKRKFDIHQQQISTTTIRTTTTNTLNSHQQQLSHLQKYNDQMTEAPLAQGTFKTTASTTSPLLVGGAATQPTRSSAFHYNGRSSTTTSRSNHQQQPNYFDNYFKKIHDHSSTIMYRTSTTTTTTTASPYFIKQQQQQQTQKPYNPYGNFLKRTQITSTSTSSSNSNNNNSNLNHNSNGNNNYKNKKSSSGSSSISSIPTTTTEITQQQQKQKFNYLSNYISDTTNNSPKILIQVEDNESSSDDQQQQHQQEQEQQVKQEQEQPEQFQYNKKINKTTKTSYSAQSQLPTTRTTSTSTKSSSSSTTTTLLQTQEKPKTKIQKLIRRQYRRSQVK